jgi:hypothetical protein
MNYTTTNEHRALSQEMSPGKSLLTPDQGVFFKKKKEQQCALLQSHLYWTYVDTLTTCGLAKPYVSSDATGDW